MAKRRRHSNAQHDVPATVGTTEIVDDISDDVELVDEDEQRDAPVRRVRASEFAAYCKREHPDKDPHHVLRDEGLPTPTRLYNVITRGKDVSENVLEVEAVDESEAVRVAILRQRIDNPSRCSFRVILIEE